MIAISGGLVLMEMMRSWKLSRFHVLFIYHQIATEVLRQKSIHHLVQVFCSLKNKEKLWHHVGANIISRLKIMFAPASPHQDQQATKQYQVKTNKSQSSLESLFFISHDASQGCLEAQKACYSVLMISGYLAGGNVVAST